MKESRGLTVRSFLLGLVIISFVNIWIAYSEYIVHASRMNLSHFPLAMFVVFLVTVVPVNFVLKLFGRRFELHYFNSLNSSDPRLSRTACRSCGRPA